MLNNEISLHVPTFKELYYRQTILSQPDTMDYNKGYELNFIGYHKDSGCIDFPKNQWVKWYSHWIDNKPISYYAYIQRDIDHKFIGEVNLHYKSEHDWYDMGIIMEGKYRGLGYSKQALHKLLIVAFEEYQAKAVHNEFENYRTKAFKLHQDEGFNIISNKNDIINFLIEEKDFRKLLVK